MLAFLYDIQLIFFAAEAQKCHQESPWADLV